MAHMLNYDLAVPDVDDAGVLSALVAEGDLDCDRRGRSEVAIC